MKDNTASAPVMAGLVVGIAFVVLFSTFSASLANYSRADNSHGKIVFAGVLDKENSQIYVVNVDGSGQSKAVELKYPIINTPLDWLPQ